MKRHIRRIALVAFVVMCIYGWGLHVVGASDSKEDQEVKLRVRDAVLASLEEGLKQVTDPQAAYDYVARMLPKVEEAANRTLAAAGFSDTVAVSLTEEAFPFRPGCTRPCVWSSAKGRGKTGGAWSSHSCAWGRNLWRRPACPGSCRKP